MEILSQETETLLNDLDTKAGELLEDLEDNYDIYEDTQLNLLFEELNDLQHRITTIQESQGWLDPN